MTKLQQFTQRFFFGFCFCLLAVQANAVPSRNLVIAAEPQMAGALSKISREFSQKTNSIVAITFDPTLDLIAEIDAGEPMDVVISAHSELMENLRNKGLIDVHNVNFVAADVLAIVTRTDNPTVTIALREGHTIAETLKMLDANGAKILLDSENSSAGKIAGDLLQSLSLSNVDIFRKIPEDKSSLLSQMKRDNQLYAILLQSQVINEKRLVTLFTEKNATIYYQASIVAGDNMETAREFVKFLRSNFAKNTFREFGFKDLGK